MTFWIGVVVGGVLLVEALKLLVQRWRADRSDPYVTLSEMRHRLKPLTKKD